MSERQDVTASRFCRGLAYALPVSLAFWAVLAYALAGWVEF